MTLSLSIAAALLGVALLVLALAYARLASRAKDDTSARLLEGMRGELNARVEGLAARQGELQGALNQQLSATQSLLDQRLEAQGTALRDQLGRQSASLQGQNELLQKHLAGNQTTLSALTERMGMIQQASARMAELGREMEELQTLLKAPKTRGNLGELGLETLLNDLLPRDRVVYQYAFADGKKVDAVIRLDKGLLPVDAKFPMEDFQRLAEASDEERPRARKAFHANLKKKIDEIAKLYVRPGEGTLPLALMYLPAESLYYEAFVAREKDEEDLWTYAFAKSVLPLSPGTLSAYLKTVSMGLRAAAVEQNARQVLELLHTLERDLKAFRESHETLGKHLNNAGQKYEETGRQLAAFEGHLARARDLGEGEGPGAGDGGTSAGP